MVSLGQFMHVQEDHALQNVESYQGYKACAYLSLVSVTVDYEIDLIQRVYVSEPCILEGGVVVVVYELEDSHYDKGREHIFQGDKVNRSDSDFG